MILIVLADGFEEIEALTPLDILRRAGLDVKTLGIAKKSVLGAHGISVEADILESELNYSSLECVIFPGGMPGAKNLNSSPITDRLIEAINTNGGRLAAICAAPMIFGARGLLCGKEATCYPGFENELLGAEISEKSVVTDGNITTAKGMGVAIEFSLEIVRLLISKEAADSISKAIIKD